MSGARPNAIDRAARVWTRPALPSESESAAAAETAAAVVAHGLLGNLAVVRGATRMLLADPDLPQPQRDKLLALLDGQVELVQGVLTDLVRGLPEQALAALDALRRP